MVKGFTLIELLITVAILAILSMIGFYSFQLISKNARDTKRQADLKLIQSGLQEFYDDQFYYPESVNFGGSLTFGNRTYISNVPKDPIGNTQYLYEALSAGCNNSITKCLRYCLYAKLENSSSISPVCADKSGYNLEIPPP